MKKPQVEKTHLVYKGFCDLREDTLKTESGTFIYNILLSKLDAVCILGKTKDEKFLVTTEYRHPIEKTLLSLPGGRVEKDETPLEAAKRELLEETGFSAKSFSILKDVYPLPALCDQKVTYVFAENIEKTQKQNLDPLEEITTHLLTLEEIQQKVKTEEVDGVFLTAFQLLRFYS